MDFKKPNKLGDSVLHICLKSFKPNRDVMKLLLEKNADLSAKDKAGNSPLHVAVLNRNQDAVHLLLKAGANPKEKNNQNKTVFYIAQKEINDRHITELLIQKHVKATLKAPTLEPEEFKVEQEKPLQTKMKLNPKPIKNIPSARTCPDLQYHMKEITIDSPKGPGHTEQVKEKPKEKKQNSVESDKQSEVEHSKNVERDLSTGTSVDAYPMLHTPRGICLILNVQHFESHAEHSGHEYSDRAGSEQDVNRLELSFRPSIFKSRFIKI